MLATNGPRIPSGEPPWHIPEGDTSVEDVSRRLMGAEDDFGSLRGPARQGFKPGILCHRAPIDEGNPILAGVQRTFVASLARVQASSAEESHRQALAGTPDSLHRIVS
jgi:hypothetical protein